MGKRYTLHPSLVAIPLGMSAFSSLNIKSKSKDFFFLSYN